MGILFSGLGLSLAGFVLHVIVWRIKPPLRQTRGLLIIFFGSYLIGMLFWNRIPGAPGLSSFAEYLHSLLLFASLALGYIITYSAIEAESPTLTMIRALQSRGGMTPGEFSTLMSDEVLVSPRLKDLLRDGLAELREGRYAITPKGARFINIFVFYRGLMSAPKKGG